MSDNKSQADNQAAEPVQEPISNNSDNLEPVTTGEEPKFTQTDVNNFVSKRVNEVKAKFADYDEMKAKVAELEPKVELIAELEASLKETLSETLSELDEEKVKDLVPEGLDVLAQLNFIRKNRKHLLKVQTSQDSPGNPTKPITNMPESNKPRETVNNLAYGGGKYATLGEFATKDPHGYREWAKKNPRKN